MKKIWIRALVLIAATVVGVIAKADEPAITSQPVPTAPANAATERRAAWDKAWQRLQQAERESLDAINASLLDVDGSFAGAAKSVPKFVEDILGLWGKWQFTVGMGGQLVNGTAWLMDGVFGTKLGQPAGPDSFRAFAEEQFVKAVADPDVLKKEIENAATSYVTKLRAIENRLLVDIGADLPDAELRMPRIPVPKLADTLLAQVDAAVSDIIADAAADFGMTVVKEAVCQVGSGIVTGMVFSNQLVAQHLGTSDPFSLAVMGTGAIAGLGVSWAVDRAVEAMGADPKSKLAAKLVERLKRVRGTRDRGRGQGPGLALCLVHPFPPWASRRGGARRLRQSRSQAGSGHLPRPAPPLLSTLHAQRLCARRRLVFHSIFGDDAPEAVELCLHPKQAGQLREVMASAREYLFPRKPIDRSIGIEPLRTRKSREGSTP